MRQQKQTNNVFLIQIDKQLQHIILILKNMQPKAQIRRDDPYASEPAEKRIERLERQLSYIKSELPPLDGSMNDAEIQARAKEYDNRKDPEFGNQGPLSDKQRKCSNFPCCILLIIMIALIFGFTVYAITSPNWKILTTFYDAEGFGCGVPNDQKPEYANYPYGYFVKGNSENLWRTVCVKRCPQEGQKALECLPNKYITKCVQDLKADAWNEVEVYPSKLVWNKFCMPLLGVTQQEVIQAAEQSNIVSRVLSIGNGLKIIIAAIPFSLVISVLIMLLIKLTKRWTIYMLLFLSLIACVGFGVYMLIRPPQSKLSSNLYRILGKFFCVFLITFGAVMVVGFLKNRERIKLAYIVVKESARFISNNRQMVIVPFILLAICLFFICLAFVQAFAFYSMGTKYRNERQLPFQHFVLPWRITGLMVLHIFHFAWVMLFLIDTNDFIVSGTAVNWYHNPKSRNDADDMSQISGQQGQQVNVPGRMHQNIPQPNKNPQQRQSFQTQYIGSNFRGSIWRYFRYHIGSVAFGSFLRVVFGISKFLYNVLSPEYSDKMKFSVTSDLKKCIDLFCCCCVNYIFNCINSGTYAYIHLTGHSYCASSIEVLQLKIKEGTCQLIISFMGLLFSVIVRVSVTFITVLVAYMIKCTVQPFKSEIEDATLFSLIIGVIAFVISSLFGSFYIDSMQALFVCYLLDNFDQTRNLVNSSPPKFKKFMRDADQQMGRQGNQLNKKKLAVPVKAKKMKQVQELDGIKEFVMNAHDPCFVFNRLRNSVIGEEKKKQQKILEKKQQKQPSKQSSAVNK